MFKRTDTDLDTQPATKRQKPTCVLKNAKFLCDVCCCLNEKGNEIIFRISISSSLTTIAGLDEADQWLGLQGHRTPHQCTFTYVATFHVAI